MKRMVFNKRVLTIIWMHMQRVQLIDPALQEDYTTIVTKIPDILEFTIRKVFNLIHRQQAGDNLPEINPCLKTLEGIFEFKQRFMMRVESNHGLEYFDALSKDTFDKLKRYGGKMHTMEDPEERKRLLDKA